MRIATKKQEREIRAEIVEIQSLARKILEAVEHDIKITCAGEGYENQISDNVSGLGDSPERCQ